MNPLVGIPNDLKTVFKGVDLYGFPATTFNRVISGVDIFAFGTAKGVFGGSKILRTWANWGNYGTTGYSVVGTYVNYSRKK